MRRLVIVMAWMLALAGLMASAAPPAVPTITARARATAWAAIRLAEGNGKAR